MDADAIGLLFQLGFVAILLLLGLFSGTFLERSHFKRLDRREAETKGVIVTQLKSFPGGASPELPPKMFAAEAVIASDYFKSFLSGIRKFFGGEMRSYLSLLERARREAQCRVVEQAAAEGYDTIGNLRFETVDIGGATNPKRPVVTVAILAVGTAYKRKPRVKR
ncbi:MAG: heavy metal-binding domain-containing protein [Planctomycetota bacterium]